MSGGTYEANVAPPWGMAPIAEAAGRLGASAMGAGLGQSVARQFMADVEGCARLLGAPCVLDRSHSRLGGEVTGLAIQTRGGLRMDLQLEAHPQPIHARQFAVRATVQAGQQVACHVETREIKELFETIAAAGWSFAGPVVEHPPGAQASVVQRSAQEQR